MKAGRKSIHAFNDLEVGGQCELKGKAAKYPHQTTARKYKLGWRFKFTYKNGRVFARRLEDFNLEEFKKAKRVK